MNQNTLTTHVEQSKDALAALLKKLIGTEIPLETESPEQSSQERSSSLREKAADRFCLEAPEHGVLVALSLDWVPVVSEAMLGERLEPDADGAADLMREFGSQAFGTVQSTLAAEGMELPSVEFETVGPETTPSVPTGPTWRVPFSADHEDTTLDGVVLMPSESGADAETPPDESSSGSFTERSSSSQESSRQAPSSASADSDSEVEVSSASFGEVGEEDLKGKEEVNNFGLLAEVDLEVRVELGRRELPLADVLKLTTGSVVELEKMVGEPLSVYANGRLIAEGEAVVIDEQFGVRITNLASEEARNKAFF
jgi:flagellar motor switch protein FliN/FliY